jgi:hypothetical protein
MHNHLSVGWKDDGDIQRGLTASASVARELKSGASSAIFLLIWPNFLHWTDHYLGFSLMQLLQFRCGGFSDRSICYMAEGRLVLHQDTGFADWLPTGKGVFIFSEIDDVLEALEHLDADYERHSRAARAIAEEYFDANKVLPA